MEEHYKSIREHFAIAGMTELCEHWRTRHVGKSVLSDIYDGEVYKNFKRRDGSHFFDLECRYGLMLNVDWFQSFKRRSDYSVGVFILSL